MEHKERIRTSIAIKGINRSTPDNAVEDGALQACNNLRFANGAWRNVQNFETTNIPSAVQGAIENGAELAYIHPVSNRKVYITKKGITKTINKVQYYAIRNVETLTSLPSPKVVGGTGGDNFPSSDVPSDFKPVVDKTNSYENGNLTKNVYTYYLDAPLEDVGKKVVRLYAENATTKKMEERGLARSYDNGVLRYTANTLTRDGHILLRYASTTYRSAEGYLLTEVFYFPTVNPNSGNPSATEGERSVFVKRGENYIYFGNIVAFDSATNKYTISNTETNYIFDCEIASFGKEYIFLPNYVVNGSGRIHFNTLTEGALILRNDKVSGTRYYSFGYIESINTTGIHPRINNGLFVYEKADGELATFAKNDGEENEAYYSRFIEALDADRMEQSFYDEICIDVFYSIYDDGTTLEKETGGYEEVFDSTEVSTMSAPTLVRVSSNDAKNKTTPTTIEIGATLTAFDEADTAPLNTFGEFSNNLRIEHFGNMLIVRDLAKKTIHHYLFADNSYETYGVVNDSNILSFKVSLKESKQVAEITDIPMIYKACTVSAGDGSLDMALFIGAAESIGGSAKSLPTTFTLPKTSGDYMRGEFAMFVIARAEDGTELYRTPPQFFRSENILKTSANILIYSPACDETDVKVRTLANYNNIEGSRFDNHFIVWHYERLPKTIGTYNDENISQYERYDNWVGRVGRYDKFIKPIIEKSTASKFYTLNLDIESGDTNIHDYAVYATRLHPLLVLEDGAIRTNQVKLLEEPFYRIAVLSADTKRYELTAKDFNNLEAKSDLVYESTQTAGATFFALKGMEYNNCIHSYGVSINEPIIPTTSFDGADSGAEHILCKREYDGITYYDVRPASALLEQAGKVLSFNQPSYLSFNNRLKEIAFGSYNEGKREFNAVGRFTPQISHALDCSMITNGVDNLYDSKMLGIPTGKAYWKNTDSTKEFADKLKNASASFAKYQPVVLNNLETAEVIEVINPYPINVPNRLQVSETNNPLSNPYERSYRIGTLTNEIIAVNSAAIEMSDAKFGEYPLYVFTKEGIFAMHTGNESLYSAIVPISKDVIVNPNTLTIDGAVLFVSDKGIHLLSNQGSQLVSAGLHEVDNRIPEWMYTCDFAYLPEYKEVLCILKDEDGNTTGEAYVLSLDNSCWSKRSIPSGYMLQRNVVVTDNYGLLHDITNEGDAVAQSIYLETRPISLGASKELKRLETLIVRFEADKDEELEVEILGSVNGQTDEDSWQSLRKVPAKTNTDVLIRRTPASVKYLKFVVKSSNLQSSIRLIRFDTEHYLRFVRKMR